MKVKVKHTKKFFAIFPTYCYGCKEKYYFEVMYRVKKAGAWCSNTYCERCKKKGEILECQKFQST